MNLKRNIHSHNFVFFWAREAHATFLRVAAICDHALQHFRVEIEPGVPGLGLASLILWAYGASFRVGQALYFYMFPFTLHNEDHKSRAFRTVKKFKRYCVTTTLCLGGKLFLIAWAVRFLLQAPPCFLHAELFNCINMIAFVLFTAVLQSYALFRHSETLKMLNLILGLCLEYLGRVPPPGDAAARFSVLVMLGYCLVGAVAPALLAVGGFYALENEISFQMFQTGSTAGNLLVAAGVWYWIQLDLVILVAYANSYIAHAVALLNALRRLALHENRLRLREYRRLQITQAVFLGAAAPIIALTFLAGSIFALAGFYIVIRFRRILHPFYLLVVAIEGLGFVLAIQIIIHLAIDVLEAALLFAASNRPRHERLKFRALQPIAMWVGGLFALTTRAFFLETLTFLMQNGATLLVAFPAPKI